MKTIQGRVLFGVIPIYNNGLSVSAFKQAHDLLLSDVKIYGSFRLSEITEQQASELVDVSMFYMGFFKNYTIPESRHRSDQCKTAKDSLISLLKANDCWIKEWKEKPTGKFVDIQNDTVDWGVGKKRIDYNNTPDDWLVVRLDNTPPTPR